MSGKATADDAAGQLVAVPDPSATAPANGAALANVASAQAVAAVATAPTAAAPESAGSAAKGQGDDPLAITDNGTGKTGGPQVPVLPPRLAPTLTDPAGATGSASPTGTTSPTGAAGKATTPNVGTGTPQDANVIPQALPATQAPTTVAPAPAADETAVIANVVAAAGLVSPTGDATSPDGHAHDVAAPTDSSGNAGLAAAAQTATGASATNATASARPNDAAAAPVPLAEVAVTIAAQAKSGKSRFDIRLDPAELGRIDVQLNVDSSGNVSSRLVVERPDTLNMLVRDAPQLQRALQDAGLNTSGGMQFSLADQGFANRNGFAQQNDLTSPPPARTAVSDPVPIAALQGYGAWSSRNGGLDITV